MKSETCRCQHPAPVENVALDHVVCLWCQRREAGYEHNPVTLRVQAIGRYRMGIDRTTTHARGGTSHQADSDRRTDKGVPAWMARMSDGRRGGRLPLTERGNLPKHAAG